MTSGAAGAIIADRFEVLSRAARGGTALVYRARDRSSGAQIALKLSAADPQSVERSRHEAEILAAVSHPSVPAYVAHGDHEGRAFLATRWIDGATLDDLLARRRLDAPEAAMLGLGVVDVLSALHAAGIVHRDVTPSNVLAAEGALARPALVDFGVAARIGEVARFRAPATAGFAAPEQVSGAPPEPAADVFGLGCCLFLALTGSTPFGSDADAASRARTGEAPRLWAFDESLPAELDALIARMLEGSPAERPDLREVARVLAGIDAVDGGPARAARPLSQEEKATRTFLGKPAHFAGRTEELARIESMIRERLLERRGSIGVLLRGEAGIGKSRFGEEVVRRFTASRREVCVWLGRAHPTSADEPRALLASTLRDAAELGIGDAEDRIQRAMRTYVRRHVAAGDVDRIVRFLCEQLGAPESSEGRLDLLAARDDVLLMGDQIARAWLDLVRGMAAAGPLLWIVEDAHWADAASTTLIARILEDIGDGRVFLLALARPTDTLASSPLRERLQTIDLGPMDLDACASLARRALGDESSERALVLASRAAGNPLHLEEVLRAELAGRRSGGGSVLALAQERLARADPSARRLLRAASVLDRPFPAAALVSVVGDDAPVAVVAGQLDDLVSKELLVRSAEGADVTYAFPHDLLRVAIHATLTSDDKVAAHRRAAEWLVDGRGDDARTIAGHLVSGELPEKAARWYAIAAARALSANDFAAATASAEHAAACGATGAVLGAAKAAEAEASWVLHDRERAHTAATESKALLPAGGALWHTVVACLAMTHGRRADIAGLERLAADVLATGPADGARPARAFALGRVMGQLMVLGEVDRAAPLFARIEGEAPLGGDHPTIRGWLHRARAVHALFSGDPARYLHEMQARLAVLDAAGDVRNVAHSWVYVGNAYLLLGGYAEAESALRRGLDIAERQGLGAAYQEGRHNLAVAVAHTGSIEVAIGLTESTIAFYEGSDVWLATARTYLSRFLRMKGEWIAAEEQARLACEAATGRPRRARALAELADVLLARRDGEAALHATKAAIEIVDSLGTMEEGEAHCRLVHALALDACGRTDEARAAIERARAVLLASAAKISDPHWRKSFLERVPDHARTLALAADPRWPSVLADPTRPPATSR